MMTNEKAIDYWLNHERVDDKEQSEAVWAAIDALRRTAEYEQSVEVGAVVYTVYSDEDGSFVEELTVTEISTHRFLATGKCFVHGDIGKTVFLTRQEAEAALGGGEGG